MIAIKKQRRPWGSVKHLIVVCHEAKMTINEIAFGTGLSKEHIRGTAKKLKINLRRENAPFIKYYNPECNTIEYNTIPLNHV